MKTLLIIRHAKTEQKNYDQDFERELTERGEKDCKLMSDRLKSQNVTPDLVKISPSKRTVQTAAHFEKHLKWKSESIEFVPELYNASHHVLFKAITGTDNAIDIIAIVAHNPGITDLFNYVGTSVIDNLPTTGIGLFTFETDDWNKLEPHQGKLLWYSAPKSNLEI